METFICYWLNELLRSENWEEINVLTPYLVCLVYTFKLSEYIIKYPQGFLSSLRRIVAKHKLCLWRGAAIAKKHIELYDLKKIQYFSWNAVTSTSRDKDIARNFITLSLAKARTLNEAKVGVLFQIETDFASSEDCEGMIDISPDSATPEEKEIILAPGTGFQLLKTRLSKDNTYKIDLKVTKKFEEKHRIDLLGILQDQAILKDKAIIEGIPSQRSFQLLEMLKGNKLIQNIEIRNSVIEDHIIEEIESLRLTTNVRRECVKLIDNIIVIRDLKAFIHYFSLESESLRNANTIELKEGVPKSHLKDKDRKIETLVLCEEFLDRVQGDHQLIGLSKTIKNTNELKHLDLSFKHTKWKNDKFIGFIRSIKEVRQLQSLRINLDKNQSISRNSFEIICQTIEGLSDLKRLDLDLNLSNEALIPFEKANVLGVFAQILSLDLKFSHNITDEGLNYLKGGLKTLTSLQHLSLDFSWCNEVSDEGLNYLKSVLRTLTSLKHLSLNFSWCKRVSSEVFNHPTSDLTSLVSLQRMYLNFSRCYAISDKDLSLKSVLLSCSSLHHLSLNFNSCNQISDEGFYYLNSGLSALISLQSLTLEFFDCNTISEKGLNHLKEGLISLRSLHLLLDYSSCHKISDEGLNSLKDGLISLKSLQHLSLNFNKCYIISDKGLNHLKDMLISLKSLQHLFLDFGWCSEISDKGLGHLISAFIPLKSLQHLSLNFNRCDRISNLGLRYLRNGLIYLKSLQELSLDLQGCYNISDGRFEDFREEFSFIPHLYCLN